MAMHFQYSVLGITQFSSVAIISILLAAVGTAFSPFFERLVNKYSKTTKQKTLVFLVGRAIKVWHIHRFSTDDRALVSPNSLV